MLQTCTVGTGSIAQILNHRCKNSILSNLKTWMRHEGYNDERLPLLVGTGLIPDLTGFAPDQEEEASGGRMVYRK